MYDYEKIQELIKKERFNLKPSNNIMDRRYELEAIIINDIIEQFINECKSNGTNIKFEKYYSNSETSNSIYNHCINILENKPKVIQEIFINYFGNRKSNLFSYVKQITSKSSSPHKKLFGNGSMFHQKCLQTIITLANIPKNTIIQTTQDKFLELLDDTVMQEIKKKTQLEDLENPEFIKKHFESNKLKYELEKNNEDKNFIGLDQLKRFTTLPKFIDDTVIEDGILKKTVFIEGYHGTGRTTLAQQIAYNIGLENSYYIYFKENEDIELTDYDKSLITKLLELLKKNNGVVILDNINLDTSSRTIARHYCNESKRIGLKLIFIATLEQHDNISKPKSFTRYFHHHWKNLIENELYLEFSNAPYETVQIHNNQLLESFLKNYLTLTNKQHLIAQNTETILEKIKKEFSGMIYLIKTAIDSDEFESLEDLKQIKAIEILKERYLDILNNIETVEIHNLLFISEKNIYLRITHKHYDRDFNTKFLFIQDLIDQKDLYRVNDTKFNQNYTLYFPNTVIPKQLRKVAKYRTKTTPWKDQRHIQSLVDLSVNNITNLIRYSFHKQKQRNLVEITSHLLKANYYNLDRKNSLSIFDIMNLLKVHVEHNKQARYEDKSISNMDKLLKNILQDNGTYLATLLSHYNHHIVLQWISTVINHYKNYYHVLDLGIKKKSHSKKSPKLIHLRKTLNQYIKVVKNQIELLKKIINSTLATLLSKDFVEYFMIDNFYHNIDKILSSTGIHDFKIQYQKRYETAYFKAQKSIQL